MKRNREIVLVVSFFIMLSFIVFPVVAGMQSYNDDYPTVIYGDWDAQKYDATEEWLFTGYICEFEFVYTGVREDGYLYKIRIEYDGCEPWFFAFEDLRVEYKWGSGSWKTLCLLGWIAGVRELTVDDATSSTFYLHFTDTRRNPDQTLHKWKFSDTPVLKVWY